ncbi:MAG: Na/Pi cotransporter family protein [Duodenibacillus sp.]|nr:Na/Pi cotransporter family protein [Duodenibacillus sp.]
MNALPAKTQSLLRTFVLIGAFTAAFYILINNDGILTISAGVCIFLFAMMMLKESFKILASGVLDVFLKKVADSNAKAFMFGLTLSTLVQSSGLVTIIAVSFLSAGLLSLSAGVAMIYGVNLSTAFSAWFVGYFGLKAKISMYAMPFLVFGVVFLMSANKRVKGSGMFLLSLGLLFMGISWMKEGFEFFKDSFDISQYQLTGVVGLIFYTLLGFAVTAITQSSHATLTLVIAALSVGQISYEGSIGVAIGASVGSTILTVLGSFSSNIEGKKIAAVHVFFNFFCAIISLCLIKYFLIAVDYLAVPMGLAADDYVFKLAIFTSLFNIVGVILLYPFIPQMVRALNRFMVSKDGDQEIERAKYISGSSTEFSAGAVESLNKETTRLLHNTLTIVARAICVTDEDVASDRSASQTITERNVPVETEFEALYQKRFKGIYSEIMDYAVRASNDGALSKHTTRIMDIRRANLFLASAVKEAQLLNVNILKYGFSDNLYVREEYSHIRRNLLRLLRLNRRITQADSHETVEEIKEALRKNKNKFDAIASSSLDSLIRERRISDSVATSVMNDTSLSRNISKNLYHAAEILTRTQESEV